MSAARVVDLFAGAGGFTAGAELAGARVVWAANHWRQAVEVHAANHPDVVHSCQDLQQADWAAVPDHDLLVASPACQGHSTAGWSAKTRWSAPPTVKHQADRNTAWAVIGCAEVKRPARILVENVVPFTAWALYPNWRGCLEALGYTVAEHTFDVADFGVPQNRKRVIVAASLDGRLELTNPEHEHLGFGPCVDWSTGPWYSVASKPAGVVKRIEAGRARGLGRRFLTHYVTGHRGRELTRPIGTITTKSQWALVNGDDTRMLTTDELRRGMSFAETYSLPAVKSQALRMLGNAIPPAFAAELVRQVSA